MIGFTARAAIAVAIIGAGPGMAQQPTITVQQQFDAATALTDKHDDPAALAAWDALEKRIAKNPRTRAIVLVRKSGVLLALGRVDDAVAAANAGLSGLPVADATLREDRFDAFRTLGAIAEASLDYAGGAQAYAEAERLAETPLQRMIALRGLIQTATFVDSAAAVAATKRADAALASAKTDPTIQAEFKRLNGQLLLNQGAYEASLKETGAAVTLLGGLSTKTRLDDVQVRSNYAIAALLLGKKEDARRYMAMTGAGRLNKGSFNAGSGMKMPECGGEAGIKPADVAVIEFSVADDGTVRDSAPVYAAGGGQVALEFARAARNWSWTAEQAKAMPMFYRTRVRVELRCSTAFERPSIRTYLDGELGNWLAAKKIDPPAFPDGADAVVLPRLRAQLAQTEVAQGRDALALVPILHLLSGNLVVGREESLAIARRELAIAIAHGAPPTARLAIEMPIWTMSMAERWQPKAFARLATPALSMPPYENDAVARAAIRLQIADVIRADAAPAREWLKAVGADPALPTNHPLRVGALVRLASLEQEEGNSAAASAAFASSGLSARQCALVDASPRLLGINAGGDKFPMEANAWGFEGWTKTQFDISADGRVVNQRVVTAYPPFVFSEAGLGVVKTGRYEKSYRPDGGLGCGGSEQGVSFRIP